MTHAGSRRRRLLTLADYAAIGVVMTVSFPVSVAIVGMESHLAVVVLTLSLTGSALRCLIASRTRGRSATFGCADLFGASAVALFGYVSYVHFFENAPRASTLSALGQIPLPVPIRVAGALLLLAAVLRPMARSPRGDGRLAIDCTPRRHPFTPDALAQAIGAALLSGSMVLAVVASVSLVVVALERSTRGILLLPVAPREKFTGARTIDRLNFPSRISDAPLSHSLTVSCVRGEHV